MNAIPNSRKQVRAYTPPIMAGDELGATRCDNMFGHLAVVLSQVGIAPSTMATYNGSWRLWCQWSKRAMNKSGFFDPSEGNDNMATEVANFLACEHLARRNKPPMAVAKLRAVQFFHRRTGIELPLRHPFLVAVKAGMTRESAVRTENTKQRRPLSTVYW